MYNGPFLRIVDKNKDFICSIYPCEIIDEDDIQNNHTLIWDIIEQELQGIMTELDDDLIDYNQFGIDIPNGINDIACYLISGDGKDKQIRKFLTITVKDLDRMRKHIHDSYDVNSIGNLMKTYLKKLDHYVKV